MSSKKKQIEKTQKTIILVLILGIIAIGLLGFYAFSKYIASVEGTGEAQIAKWSFIVNKQSSDEEEIDLNLTINPNNNVASERVAPGTSGSFEIEIDATKSEVALSYAIEMDLKQTPHNLTLYSDYIEGEYKNPIKVADNTATIKGYMSLEDVKTVKKQTIYWDWPYETPTPEGQEKSNDEIDTEDSKNSSMKIGVTVTGTEVLEEPKAELKFPVETVEEKVSVDEGTTYKYTYKYVDLETNILGKGTNRDWQVFHEEGGKTYLMLADYLPVDAENHNNFKTLIEETKIGLKTSGNHGVYASGSRDNLITKLGYSDGWKELLPPKLQAEEYKETIKVAGAIDLETWVKSWNSTYGTHKLKAYNPSTGYYIGEEDEKGTNPDTKDYSIYTYFNEGYQNKLYFPHPTYNQPYNGCLGYWLASPSASNPNYVMTVVSIIGGVYSNSYDFTINGVRPVVCLPSELLSKS